MAAESRMTDGSIWLVGNGCKQGDAVGRQRVRVGARGECIRGMTLGDLIFPEPDSEWFLTVSLSPSATGMRKNRRPI